MAALAPCHPASEPRSPSPRTVWIKRRPRGFLRQAADKTSIVLESRSNLESYIMPVIRYGETTRPLWWHQIGRAPGIYAEVSLTGIRESTRPARVSKGDGAASNLGSGRGPAGGAGARRTEARARGQARST